MAVAFERLDDLDDELEADAGEELVERLSLVQRPHVRVRDVVTPGGDDRLGLLLDRKAQPSPRGCLNSCLTALGGATVDSRLKNSTTSRACLARRARHAAV
jgi:hypothetical protein